MIAETGLPGFEALVWFGLFAPSATPQEMVTRLSTEVSAIVRQPKLRETFATQVADRGGQRVSDFAAKVAREHTLWGKVIREAGIKLD